MIKHLSILLVVLMSSATQTAAHLNFPDTKYDIDECITPTDPAWSWFGETARVEDIVYSKHYEAFVYHLYIPKSAISPFGVFDIGSIDYMTFKLRRCPF